MGLDMFAYAAPPEAFETVDRGYGLKNREGEELTEIAYWRKHANLHGYMQQLYAKRSGDGDPDNFNCVSLALTPEDIDAIEALTMGRALPRTEGFFFGQSTEEDDATTLAFCTKAREAIAAGMIVVYDSWW